LNITYFFIRWLRDVASNTRYRGAHEKIRQLRWTIKDPFFAFSATEMVEEKAYYFY